MKTYYIHHVGGASHNFVKKKHTYTRKYYRMFYSIYLFLYMYIIRIHTHNHNKNNKNKITIFKLYHSSGRVWSPNARLYSMNAHSTMRKIVAVVVVFAQFFAFLVALFVCCTVGFFFFLSLHPPHPRFTLPCCASARTHHKHTNHSG